MTNSSAKFVIFDDIEREKITKYFRYYPLIILQSCLKREAFMNSLTENGDMEVYNREKIAKKMNKKT
jgi:hypothetical protein